MQHTDAGQTGSEGNVDSTGPYIIFWVAASVGDNQNAILDGSLKAETFQSLSSRLRALGSRALRSKPAALKFTLEIDDDKFDGFAKTDDEVNMIKKGFAETILRYASPKPDKDCWVYVRPKGTE